MKPKFTAFEMKEHAGKKRMAADESLVVRLEALENQVQNLRNNREAELLPWWRRWHLPEVAYSAGASILLLMSVLLSVTFISMWDLHMRVQKIESQESECVMLKSFMPRSTQTELLKGRKKERALLEAAEEGNLMEVTALLHSGLLAHPDLARDTAHGSTALHLAARAGHFEICRALLDAGANVDARNKWNNTPLHIAAGAGHLQIVQLLIDHGASLMSRGYFNDTPWERATTHGHDKVAEWIRLKANPN